MSKKDNHILPNFYLKGFSLTPRRDNAKIWTYEKNLLKPFYDGKTQQLQNPKERCTKRTAIKRGYYSYLEENGFKEFDKYEDILMKYFEQPNDDILNKIRQFKGINDNEKKQFSQYISSMIMRGKIGQSIFARANRQLLLEEKQQLKDANIGKSETIKKLQFFLQNQKKKVKVSMRKAEL